jgi:hypothetical protein
LAGRLAFSEELICMPKNPPSERNRSIAQRRAEGASVKAAAAEFGLSEKRIREIVDAVRQYDRGVGILALDPNSLEGLELVGKIPPLMRVSLQARGITRLQDLQGPSLIELLQMPNLGRREAITLIDLCNAAHGHAEGKGAAWAVRARLRAGGLLELRGVSKFVVEPSRKARQIAGSSRTPVALFCEEDR